MKLDPKRVQQYLVAAYGEREDVLARAIQVQTWDDLVALVAREPVRVHRPQGSQLTPLGTYGLDKSHPMKMLLDHVIY